MNKVRLERLVVVERRLDETTRIKKLDCLEMTLSLMMFGMMKTRLMKAKTLDKMELEKMDSMNLKKMKRYEMKKVVKVS